jgi:hypothetical protein
VLKAHLGSRNHCFWHQFYSVLGAHTSPIKPADDIDLLRHLNDELLVWHFTEENGGQGLQLFTILFEKNYQERRFPKLNKEVSFGPFYFQARMLTSADYEKVTVEGTSNPVCIYLEIGEGSAKCRTLLARVDLGQLGFSEWIRRHTGNTQEIWVKGKVPSSSIRERTSWPITGKSGYGLET